MNYKKYINNLVNEIGYRSKEGYPDFNKLEHINIFKKILNEWNLDIKIKNILIENIIKIFESKKESDNVKIIRDKLGPKSANLSDDLIDKVIKKFNKYKENKKKIFMDNFRKNNKLDIKNITNFADFFEVNDLGVGYGEIMCLLSTKNSISGGTKKKDLEVKAGIYEVKKLDKQQFSLAGDGTPGNYNWGKFLNTYLGIIKNLPNSVLDLIKYSITNEYTSIEEIISYNGYPREASSKFIQNIYTSIFALSNFIEKFGNSDDTKILSVDDNHWLISSEDSKKIKKNTSIKLDILSNLDKKTDIDIHISLLKNLPWIKNNELFIENLNEIVNTYLDKIDGFVIFTSKNNVKIYTSSEIKEKFGLIRVSRGTFRLGLKNKDRIKKYKFISDQ